MFQIHLVIKQIRTKYVIRILVHIAPACAGSGRSPTTFDLMHAMFLGLNSWSQGNNFSTAPPELPFTTKYVIVLKIFCDNM
jgi:hypothetical protein